MIDINDYFYFVKVVENKGYSSAAKALNIPKSKISRHISKLEERLGQRLLQRTSRHVNTTEAGELFYCNARKVIDAMEVTENAILATGDEVTGTVTLSSSVGVANFLLKDLLVNFHEQYPKVVIKQNVSNDYVDIIPAGLDMVIRGHSSTLPDSSYIQKKMAIAEWQVFASPAFLSALDRSITTPDDLTGLPVLGFGWQSKEKIWTLRHKHHEAVDVSFQPHFCSDDMLTLQYAAQKGSGIVSLPSYVCADKVTDGSLTCVLPEWTTASAQLSILLPSRSGLSQATRVLSDYLCANAPKLIQGDRTH